MSLVFICSLCHKTFASDKTLKVHVKKKHPNSYNLLKKKPIQTHTTCGLCNGHFARQFTLKRHVKQYHAEYFKEFYPDMSYKFKCDHCHKHFTYKHHLKFHMKRHTDHATPENINALGSFWLKSVKPKICAMCQTYTTPSIDDMFQHYKYCHDITIETEELEFSSVTEFYDWKNRTEEEHSTRFRKENTKSSKHHVLTKYVCSRSGMYVPRGLGKRCLKLQGSRKINAFCPSSINLIINTEECGNLCIVDEGGLEFYTILQEISSRKTVLEEDDDTLHKMQDKLIEAVTAIIRSTTSIEEMEYLEVITSSMNPTIAAVRESNNSTISLLCEKVAEIGKI